MRDWYSTIYKALIYAGMVSFVIGFFTGPNISLDAYITGYSVFTLGILMILVVLFSNILKIAQNDTFIQIICSIFMNAGPFILILGIIGFVLYLLINYRNRIIQGQVSPSYHSFSNIIILLLFLQFYLLNSTERFETTGKMSKITSSIIYLLGVITAISAIIVYIILKYYSTDGFTV
jgi:hypothetical protein